jgi:hypothetical protein
LDRKKDMAELSQWMPLEIRVCELDIHYIV